MCTRPYQQHVSKRYCHCQFWIVFEWLHVSQSVWDMLLVRGPVLTRSYPPDLNWRRGEVITQPRYTLLKGYTLLKEITPGFPVPTGPIQGKKNCNEWRNHICNQQGHWKYSNLSSTRVSDITQQGQPNTCSSVLYLQDMRGYDNCPTFYRHIRVHKALIIFKLC